MDRESNFECKVKGKLMFRDRVFETSISTGTGSFSLAGAVTGFRTFSAAFGATGAYYSIINRDNPTEWEIGSFTVSGATLSRVAGNVLSGSAGAGTLVNFSAGTKDVFNAPPASAMATWDTYNPNTRVLKTGDTMSGQLTGTAFQTGGSAGATGFRISGGVDLAAIFQPASVINGASGSGTEFGDTNPRLTSASLARTGNDAVLTVGTACACNCANCNCACGNGCCGCCFPAGTLVTLASGEQKSIESLVPGDQVLGRKGSNNVLALYVTELAGRSLYNINSEFKVTGDHMLWTPDGWVTLDGELFNQRQLKLSRAWALGLEHEPHMNWSLHEIQQVKIGTSLGFRDGIKKLETLEVTSDHPSQTLVFCPIVDGDQSFMVAGGYLVDWFADRRVDFRDELPSREAPHEASI